MKGGIYWILGAVAIYVTALGCAMWPAERSGAPGANTSQPVVDPLYPAANLSGLPFRGLVVQVQRVDGPEVYEKAVDDIARMGADTIELVVDSKQDTVKSTAIFVDSRQTPSAEKLTHLIKYAKEKHLRVVLMPLVLLEHPGEHWRGQIQPDSWDEWFESYREMITFYASAAEAGHADVFVVGSELVSAETFTDEWRRTIHVARQTFHGLLTYSANWDHYRTVPFWDKLDIISTNSYWKLGNDHNVSVEQIIEKWKEIQADLLPWIRKQHKPYMITEVGWCSLANAAHEPWDYTKESEPLDLELQRKLFAAFFKAWENTPELGGYMIWQWVPGSEGGPTDRGYMTLNKPAEAELRKAFAMPRWTVKD